jgi:hypothetical protein
MADPKMSIGTQETKDALTFVFALVTGLQNAFADGSFTISDLPDFLPALMDLPAALSGAGDIPVEFEQMNDQDKADLIQWVKDNFQIEDAKVEQFIEDCFAIILDMWTVIRNYVNPPQGETPNAPTAG